MNEAKRIMLTYGVLTTCLSMMTAPAPLQAEDDGGELGCGAHDDNCQFLWCLCQLYHGSEAESRFWFDCHEVEGGGQSCLCICTFDDGDVNCGQGTSADYCMHEPAAAPGSVGTFGADTELALPEGPCGTPWCHLERTLQTIDGFMELAPIDVQDDGLAIGSGNPGVIGSVGGVLPVAVVDFTVPTFELANPHEPQDAVGQIALACTADHDGDGLADGVFTSDSNGWSCCKADYGCYECSIEGGRHCVIACESAECSLDQFFEHHDPPAAEEDTDALSNADGSVSVDPAAGEDTPPTADTEDADDTASESDPGDHATTPARPRQDRRGRLLRRSRG